MAIKTPRRPCICPSPSSRRDGPRTPPGGASSSGVINPDGQPAGSCQRTKTNSYRSAHILAEMRIGIDFPASNITPYYFGPPEEHRMAAYAHPEVLVDTSFVKGTLGNQNVKVVEVDYDPTANYNLGHIPGSALIDWRKDINDPVTRDIVSRSEEHTSELQSRSDLVCRLLLEKKKKQRTKR